MYVASRERESTRCKGEKSKVRGGRCVGCGCRYGCDGMYRRMHVCVCVCVCSGQVRTHRCTHTGTHSRCRRNSMSRVSRVWSVVTPIHGKQAMTSCGSCLFVLAVAWSGRRLVHASSLRPPFSSAAHPLVLLRSFVPTPLPSSSPFVFSFFFRVSSLCCFRRRPCCILLVASACLPPLL